MAVMPMRAHKRPGLAAGMVKRSVAWLVAIGSLPLLLVACASAASPGAMPTPIATPQTSSTAEYSGFLAASELVVGENRFPFAILSTEGVPLTDAQVEVDFFFLHKEPAIFKSEAVARYRVAKGVTPHTHEGGIVHEHLEVREFYTVDRVQFDQPGIWGAQFLATTKDGLSPKIEGLAFEVREKGAAPTVGSSVPPTRNPTAKNVKELSEITTHNPPEPGLYQFTVAEALAQGKPFMVLFSTPMFCVSRMCGPVTDVVARLYPSYKERMNFIHIEPWDPKTARGDGRLVPTPHLLEWHLSTEPWLFVVNKEGKVAARFEGPVTAEELEEAVGSVLAAGVSTGGRQ